MHIILVSESNILVDNMQNGKKIFKLKPIFLYIYPPPPFKTITLFLVSWIVVLCTRFSFLSVLMKIF